MSLQPKATDKDLVLEGGPVHRWKLYSSWRQFYARLDHEDPPQKILASSIACSIICTPFGLFYNYYKWTPKHSYSTSVPPWNRVIHDTITRCTGPALVAGALFGFGVTTSSIMRGYKDGPLNHAVGALLASTVLLYRAKPSTFFGMIILAPVVMMAVKQTYELQPILRIGKDEQGRRAYVTESALHQVRPLGTRDDNW